jgi:CheY-like chemotaxis protein
LYFNAKDTKSLLAANGIEALEKLSAEKVQIALSDIMMPKMDGFELIKRIRGNPALKSIYLILITARIQEGDRVRGLDLGQTITSQNHFHIQSYLRA